MSRFPDWAQLPTVYLPPENKGFDIELLFGEDIGLEPGSSHPLPWYPPTCDSSTVTRPAKYSGLAKHSQGGGRAKFPDEHIRPQFLLSLGRQHRCFKSIFYVLKVDENLN